jgi:hypothetical protein
MEPEPREQAVNRRRERGASRVGVSRFSKQDRCRKNMDGAEGEV